MEVFDLKRFRGDKNITQDQLTLILGCKQSFISAVEKGKKKLSDDKISLLKDKYGDLSGYITKENNSHDEASVANLEEKDTTLLIVQMMNNRLIAPFSLIEDRDREIARLNKEIAKLSRETGRLEAQLEHSKKGFVPKGGNAICAAAE